MTYQLGLIGYPIKHSLSPWIHGEFFKRTDLHGTYHIFEIDIITPFEEAMDDLKAQKLDGFNVTVPYKEKIIPFLDEIDDTAKSIGAVNTVLCQDGKWIGYNTDGAGYVRSLLSKYPALMEQKTIPVLLLGAGGAAKGIYHALQQSGFTNITIANRTIEKAQHIIGNDVQSKVSTIKDVEEHLQDFPLIIQTTSVGMKPHIHDKIISLKGLSASTIVSDIVYQPLVTAFLLEAQKNGAKIHFGHTMLLYQAQYAFEIWTGQTPSMEQLDKQLQTILEG